MPNLLIEIVKSEKPEKRWKAIFILEDGSIKNVHFGSPLYENYTMHHDKKRRSAYLKRHVKDLETNDPMTAGYLSYFILWGPTTSMKTNTDLYKEMFDL
jgi:hypothetical protein